MKNLRFVINLERGQYMFLWSCELRLLRQGEIIGLLEVTKFRLKINYGIKSLIDVL